MDEDRFNMEVRKFLKQVGITSQREIETAVRQGLALGKLNSNAALSARMVLTIPELGLSHEIKGSIVIG
jgi:hypothetical protein